MGNDGRRIKFVPSHTCLQLGGAVGGWKKEAFLRNKQSLQRCIKGWAGVSAAEWSSGSAEPHFPSWKRDHVESQGDTCEKDTGICLVAL